MTVASVVDRIYRDYLSPPGEQPSRFEVGAGGIDASATTLPVDATLLNPEEQDLIGSGSLIEVESELMLVESVTGDPPTSLEVRRGMYDTSAAAHTADTFVYLTDEDYMPRHSVFVAVADAIESLWPDLYTIGVEETFASNGPIELPSDVGEVVDMLVQTGSRWRRLGGWNDLQDYPLASTGNAIQVSGVPSNTSIQVYYKTKTIRPTAESDTLASLNVETNWVKLIVVQAVAQLVSRADLSKATVDFITEALEAEAGGPVGTGADIRNALVQFSEFQLQPLKRQLQLKQHDRLIIEAY